MAIETAPCTALENPLPFEEILIAEIPIIVIHTHPEIITGTDTAIHIMIGKGTEEGTVCPISEIGSFVTANIGETGIVTATSATVTSATSVTGNSVIEKGKERGSGREWARETETETVTESDGSESGSGSNESERGNESAKANGGVLTVESNTRRRRRRRRRRETAHPGAGSTPILAMILLLAMKEGAPMEDLPCTEPFASREFEEKQTKDSVTGHAFGAVSQREEKKNEKGEKEKRREEEKKMRKEKRGERRRERRGMRRGEG